MAGVVPPVTSTKETTNYARLCRLLVDIGCQALRDTFNHIHPPESLQKVLATPANQNILQTLFTGKKKILNPTQWDKLYPPMPSSVSSVNFDITLLMVLLRNICGLSPPASGWNELPPEADKSREADIARLKYFRNTMYAHAEQASIDDVTFNTHWQSIRDVLVRLGGAKYGDAIHKLKTECMDPVIEERYKELLQQWKMDESNIHDQLLEMGNDIKDIKEALQVASDRPIGKETSELPDQPPNIHGHERELTEIVDALTSDGNVTVVLVSGAAGIGKTTVAIQASYRLKDGTKDVRFCDLRGACANEDEMVRTILNDCDSGHQQANSKPKHILLQWCRRLESESILVLDNAEDALADDSLKEAFTKLLGEMRKYAPQKHFLKFLITSRCSDISSIAAALTVMPIEIGPLNLEESVKILKDGAKLQSDFDLVTQKKFSKVADICERIPLALRLAGPLLSTDSEYSFEELIQELEKKPTKTLGLQRMMGIAFEQLDEPLQHALVCLSVFVRSFDKEAVKALLGDKCPEMLTKLRRRSLIEKQQNRYHLHLLTRDYARQMGEGEFQQILVESRQSFLKHFLSLMLYNTSKYWEKGGCKSSLDLFDGERLNFELTLKIVGSQAEKLKKCKELEDVVNKCWLVAPYIGDCVPFKLHDDFLNGLLQLAQRQGKVIQEVEISCLLYDERRKRRGAKQQLHGRAIELHDENVHLFEQNGLSEVFYLSHYGRYLSQDCDRREEAQPFLSKALFIYENEKRASTFDKARILGQMGHNAKALGRPQEALKYHSEALKFRQDHYGDHVLTAFAHKDLADYFLSMEKLIDAEENYNRAIHILEDMKIAEHKAIRLYTNLGVCFQRGEMFDESRKTFEKGCDIADDTIEGSDKWNVQIKTCLALLLYKNYQECQEDVSRANEIAKEVLQMGRELNDWMGKEELEEMYRKHHC